jgi:hypothetical protein
VKYRDRVAGIAQHEAPGYRHYRSVAGSIAFRDVLGTSIRWATDKSPMGLSSPDAFPTELV